MSKFMKGLSALLLVVGFLVVFAGCDTDRKSSDDAPKVDLNPEETFTSDDAPKTFTVEELSVKGPWGYDKSSNGERQYPLVVVGFWGEGSSEYASVEQRYPAFVIDYQKDSEGDGTLLAEWITRAIEAGYRIDINRIYLTGFSRGGSGSFPLAKGMQKGGRYFAAINRVAGQSQSDLTNEIAEKTAVWYHLGLADTEQRVTVARTTLANFRAYACNSEAKESKSNDTIQNYARETVRLNRGGFDMFIYSEYTGMGHDAGPCYSDTNIFPWMFSHSLSLR